MTALATRLPARSPGSELPISMTTVLVAHGLFDLVRNAIQLTVIAVTPGWERGRLDRPMPGR